jgi:hypothetical protein
MRRLTKKYPFTMIAITIGLVVVLLGKSLDLDLWELFTLFVAKGEAFELDEYIIPIFILMMGITLDAVLTNADQRKLEEKVSLYNHMNQEIMDEISNHLTKLLEFRTALMKDAPNAHDVRHELDRMIVKSFNHYERSQRRGNIDSNLMSLVTPGTDSEAPSSMPSKPENQTDPANSPTP